MSTEAGQPGPSPIPCKTCSYDITSLPESALCPECATAVRDSRLKHAESLNRLAGEAIRNFGYRLLICSLVMALFAITFGNFKMFGHAFFGATWHLWWLLFMPPLLIVVSTWIATFIPNVRPSIPIAKPRIIARWLSVAVLLVVLMPPAAILVAVRSQIKDDGGLIFLLWGFCSLLYPTLGILIALNIRDFRRLCKSATPQPSPAPPPTADSSPL